MRRLILLVSLLLLALVVPHSAHAITFGVPDDDRVAVGSFVGTVTDPETGDQLKIQLCTGTLIAPSFVLSASHCFVGLEAFGITHVTFTLDAVIDENRDGLVDADVQLLEGVARTHERFGTGGAANTHDIALFELSSAVTGVAPMRLAPAGYLDQREVQGDTFVAVGYGVVRDTHQGAGQSFLPGWRRLQVEQRLNSVTKAWATFSMNPARGDGGTCFGDSGGPHLHGDLVVSLTVTGDSYCKASDKTYRVDTPWARDFLDDYVALP